LFCARLLDILHLSYYNNTGKEELFCIHGEQHFFYTLKNFYAIFLGQSKEMK